jgi:predicted porin
MGRALWAAALLAATGFVATARADDDEAPSSDPYYRLDTKNLFGSLEGSDVGDAGDRSIEMETTASLFKAFGRYAFVGQDAVYETTLTPRFDNEFGVHGLAQSIHGTPGVSDYSGVDFSGLTDEMRYVLSPRSGPWSVQATVTVMPQWTRVFEGGARGQDFALPLLFIVDAQPIARRLYAALNLTYTPEIQRVDGAAWTQTSDFSASGALSWRLTPAAMIGAEADVVNQFDGLAGQSWQGSALFLGPTFHYQVNDKLDFSGAFTQQVAGRARGVSGALDLADFTRSSATFRVEIEF